MRHGRNKVKVRLRGVNTVRRYRKDSSFALYHYHMATGRRLEGERGSPEFIESYAAAERSVRERSKGTISDLIRRFEGTPELPNPDFDDMAASTKAEYRRKFKIIDGKWGSAPIVAFNDKQFRIDVINWRDQIAKRGRREADNLVSALNRLGSWAFDRGEIDRNVLDNIKRVYHSDRADILWLPEHVQAFTAKASPELIAALMLAMHTGQRQGDLRALPWSAYDGERITLRQSKRRKGTAPKTVSIRCTAALRAMLDKMANNKRGVLILTTPAGRPWTKRYLNQKWNEVMEAAKLTDLHFHDLRGTAITMLAEAGCSVPEIASITGHTFKHVNHILETYLSRTRHLADAAILKLERHLKRLKSGPK
jgi:integrase